MVRESITDAWREASWDEAIAFAVMAISAAYGSRLAVATVVLYLAEGLVGHE